MKKIKDLITILAAYYQDAYKKSDPIHGMEHILEVANMSAKLANEYAPGDDYVMKNVLIAASIHDMFSDENRGQHHKLARNYALMDREDYNLIGMSAYRRNIIGYAVLQHRASNMPETFHSLEAEILASADRGIPTLEAILARSSMGGSVPDKEHIKKKYGTGGYIEYPPLYIDHYGHDMIHKMQQDVDAWCES